jgi:hypothetical protein
MLNFVSVRTIKGSFINRQPATVGAEERGGKDTTSSRTTTGAAPELNPPKSACAGDPVIRTSTRGTVPMGQCAGFHRGQHLTVHICLWGSGVYVFITAVPITVTITKLFAWGEGDSGGHVLRETTSRGLCGIVCPSRTSERW